MIVAMVSAPRAQVGERGSGRSYLKEIPSHAQGIVVCGKIRDAGSCYFPQIGEIMIRFPLVSSCLRRSFLFRGEISQLGKSPSFSFFFPIVSCCFLCTLSFVASNILLKLSFC